MFGRLLKLVSLCSAAFLWTRMAENMLSNRAGAAQKWVKQSRQAAVTTDRWVLHSNTHSHTHTGTYALCLFLLVALPQSRRGVQSNSCMETLHAHNADGRSLCASTCNRLHRRPWMPPLTSCHRLLPPALPCSPVSQLLIRLFSLFLFPLRWTSSHSSSILHSLLVFPADWGTFSPDATRDSQSVPISQPDIKMGTVVGQLLPLLKWAERMGKETTELKEVQKINKSQ